MRWRKESVAAAPAKNALHPSESHSVALLKNKAVCLNFLKMRGCIFKSITLEEQLGETPWLQFHLICATLERVLVEVYPTALMT